MEEQQTTGCSTRGRLLHDTLTPVLEGTDGRLAIACEPSADDVYCLYELDESDEDMLSELFVCCENSAYDTRQSY